MKPETYERARRWIAVVAWVYFVYMAYMLLHPKPPAPPPIRWIPSWIHFAAFALLGALAGLARGRLSNWRLFALLVLWGIGSEFLQRYTGRYCEVRDMIQNVLGISTGLSLAILTRRILISRGNDG
ncbi:MAG: hypothetical protein IJM30_02880 [Thermoguttaceae bacterium]|nr:hypothetical protein [Thermoguttaceae bacterium]